MKNQNGYTILEVLVAVIILAIALPGLTYMTVGSRKTQVNSLRFENAASFGQRVYDELSLLPPAQIPATGYKTETLDGQNYTAKWIVTEMKNSAGTFIGGHKANITIIWTTGGKTHSSILSGALQ